ncbi:MAG: hypothetical protein EOP48_33085, partial [Sphingobacteriales bacterium]
FISPTGSGKTVVATQVIEKLATDSLTLLETEKVSFVWISDAPYLNDQVYDTMKSTGHVLENGHMVRVSATSFDQEKLESGFIYFLNTQKLGKDKRLSKGGDERRFSFWETLENTYKDQGKNTRSISFLIFTGKIERI